MKNLFFCLIGLFFATVGYGQKNQPDTAQYPVYGTTNIKVLNYGPISSVSIELWVHDRHGHEILYANIGLSTAIKYPSLAHVADKEYINLMTNHGLAVMKRHYIAARYVKPNEIPETQPEW